MGAVVLHHMMAKTGTIVEVDFDYTRVYRVKFPDGAVWRYDDSEIEAAQETPYRPKVGEVVLFVIPVAIAGKQYHCGIIEEDDGSETPFLVRVTPTLEVWHDLSEILPASKQYQVFSKLKPGMRVHTSRNGWFIVMPSCMASRETDCDFVLWNTEGCCGNTEAILDELKYTIAVYTAPLSFHDAHVPYKHGGECVWNVSEYVDPIEAQKQRKRDDIKKQIAELEKQLTSIK